VVFKKMCISKKKIMGECVFVCVRRCINIQFRMGKKEAQRVGYKDCKRFLSSHLLSVKTPPPITSCIKLSHINGI